MARDVDLVFGECYLNAADFRLRADVFGAGMALARYPESDEGDAKLIALLASASRDIDSETGRTFTAAPISENHAWNPATRRVAVNQPPVVTLESYRIRTSPGTVANFDVADVYINAQENYLELASLALAGALTSQLLALGLATAQVEITYTTTQAVPPKVALACGYRAAELMNQGFVDAIVPAGFGSIKVGNTTFNNQRRQTSNASTRMSDHIRGLLAEFRRLPVA